MTYEVVYPEQPKGDVKLRDRYGDIWEKGTDHNEGLWVKVKDDSTRMSSARGWHVLLAGFGPLEEYIEPPKIGEVRPHKFNNGVFIHDKEYFAVWTGEKWIDLRYDRTEHTLKFNTIVDEHDLNANFIK